MPLINLTFDNTNNVLNVAGNIYSYNDEVIAMSGQFIPLGLDTVVGPNIEGKFGVSWDCNYGVPASYPSYPATDCTVPSALAAAGYTIPYKCATTAVAFVCGGTRWKDKYTFQLVYVPPRSFAQPLPEATETCNYAAHAEWVYETPNTVSPTYGIAAPSLAYTTGTGESLIEMEPGGFIVPIMKTEASFPVFVDLQIRIRRIS